MAVAKQWEQTFVKGIVSSLRDKQNSITESSIYNKQSFCQDSNWILLHVVLSAHAHYIQE